MQILDTENTLETTELTGNQRIPGAAKGTLQNQRSPLQEGPGWEFWGCFRSFQVLVLKTEVKGWIDDLRRFFQPD